MSYTGHSHQKFGHITYSQHGEDLFFMNLSSLLGIDRPSYLDLGAHHPFNISNTALLYEKGSRGINIEANPLLMDEFIKHRPEDVNVCVAVGMANGEATFYMENDHSVLNSLDNSSFKQHNTQFVQTMQVQVLTLDRILKRYCDQKYPDFLLTDIEGMDLDVLATADYGLSKPKIICTEIRADETAEAKCLFEGLGFKLLCRIVSNIIFVRRDIYPRCLCL